MMFLLNNISSEHVVERGWPPWGFSVCSVYCQPLKGLQILLSALSSTQHTLPHCFFQLLIFYFPPLETRAYKRRLCVPSVRCFASLRADWNILMGPHCHYRLIFSGSKQPAAAIYLLPPPPPSLRMPLSLKHTTHQQLWFSRLFL